MADFLQKIFYSHIYPVLEQVTVSVVLGGVYLLIALFIFSVLEFLTKASPLRKLQASVATDVGYAFASFLYPPLRRFLLQSLLGLAAIPALEAGPSVHGSLEFLAILLAVLFLRDLLIWGKHRLFHAKKLWAVHAAHHSSKDVNWLSTARFHPLEALTETSLEFLLYLALYTFLGVEVKILAAAKYIVWFYNYFIHANCRWTFGPLRYLLVSPVYHRWHHSCDPMAQNRNFAAMFSVIDLLAGTFYMPKDKKPGELGLSLPEKAHYPAGFWGQIAWPWAVTRPRR